ncbi:MAG: hypothetical protein A2W00_07210 [Candidatus Eisenbacteria bacterium RBG_16_71_46]|nr:MAG: hypothetical protein A2W00_07210 [Candidatus Eisenbacteria bacterium RBG_16_71_46]
MHVPFCATRCTYCDFSSGALSAAAVERYLGALEREIALRAPRCADASHRSVFFGGGTPSALSSRHFRRAWKALRDGFRIAPDAEITLEANPESVRPVLLEVWAEAGVNRLSMGAQSFVPEELARLGRIHDAARPGEAFALARAHGFRRLSLDLMFGFPGHTAERWRRSIDEALALEPEHLSAYCFIAEPGTPLGDAAISGAAPLPAPEEQADLYALLEARLAAAGYGCYETSNFCRPGAEARHNLVYWLRRPYVGLGPSAHGLLDGVRYGNHYAPARWAEQLERGQGPESEVEPEREASAAEEALMLGLRLGGGMRPDDYSPAFWSTIRRRYGGAFTHARATGRLEMDADGVRIPAPLRFVADDVIAWVAARGVAAS